MNIEKTGTAVTLNATSIQSARASGTTDFADVMKTAQSSATTNLDAVFEEASAKYGVSVSLLKAVAKAESNFNPKATSHCGAMGVMQLMPGTAASLGVTDAYDPVQNIMGGAKYLSQLLSKFDGDVKLAVAAYNAGPNNVVKYGGVPPFDETENYVTKVLGYLGTDFTAGSVSSSAAAAGISSDMSPSNEGSALGALLTNSLLAGMLDSDDLAGLPDLLNSLGQDSKDPKAISDAVMTSVYQMQLKMLQGDESGSSFIV